MVIKIIIIFYQNNGKRCCYGWMSVENGLAQENGIRSINYLEMSRKWNCIDDGISRMIKRFGWFCANDKKTGSKWNDNNNKRRNTISLQNNRSSQCIACAFFISKAVGYCVWMVHNDNCHFHHIPGRSFGSSTQTKQTNENKNHLNMKTLYQGNYSILLPCSAS